jgi:hypothetical protein
MSMTEAQKDSERKGVASFKGGSEAAGASEQEQVVVTINASMGKVVRVEKIDKAGKSQELPEKEWAKLVGDDEVEEIEAALDEAFEAGVAAALREEYEDDDEAYEDDEETALRRLLVGELQRRRPVQRRILQRLLMKRVLRRWFVKHPLHQ